MPTSLVKCLSRHVSGKQCDFMVKLFDIPLETYREAAFEWRKFFIWRYNSSYTQALDVWYMYPHLAISMVNVGKYTIHIHTLSVECLV